MSDDHRALIDEGRELHRPGRNGSCLGCPDYGGPVQWPCVTARLADALEDSERAVSIADQAAAQWERNHNGVRDQRDAALACLAQAERERDELRASINATWATTQATLVPTRWVLAAGGGYNAGCPDGDGLGTADE